MSRSRRINVSQRIDALPLGPFQIRVIALCIIIALLEGFDTQVIAFVAPSIAAEWNVPTSSFGPAFSASLFGLMIGALTLGALGDRIGRKAVTILSFTSVGAFTFLTARAETMSDLVFWRFLTGIGLGGTIPNALALVSEYSPKRLRSLSVAIVSAGFPLGAALGGLIAGPLISQMGWRSAFYLGGALPLALSIVLILFLPESIRLLAALQSKQKAASVLLARIDPSYVFRPGDVFHNADASPERGSLPSLFTQQRAPGTLLLWGLFALNLLMLYLVLNWLPIILSESGLALPKAIYAVSFFMAGGIVSGIVLGRIIDKTTPYLVMAGVYIFAAIFAAALAAAGSSTESVFVLVTLAGATILGPQPAINALAANFYPVNIRSLGVGAALSVGRVGAIAGPLFGGFILSSGSAPAQVLYFLAIPACLCALFVFMLGRAAARTSRSTQPIREFDHLMCGMRDITVAGKTFEKLGFTVGPVTPLEGVGVANRRILLTPNASKCANYIELMQLGGAEGDIPLFLEKWLKGSRNGHEGAGSMIMRTDNARDTFKHFMQRHKTDPDGGFRPILLEHEFDQFGPNNEKYRVAFSNCIMPNLEPPLYLSTSEIKTLDFYLDPRWREHGNGARSWTATVAVSDTPAATALSLQDVWGGYINEVSTQCVVAAPGEMPLTIMTPDVFVKTYGENAYDGFRPRPFIAGVHLSSLDLEKTRNYLHTNMVQADERDRRIILPPRSCHGLMICFE